MASYEKRVKWVEEYLSRIDLDEEIKSYYEGKNILVTGGAGAIGSNLIIALSKLVGNSGKIIILDNLSSIKDRNPWNVTPLQNVMFVEGDVRSDETNIDTPRCSCLVYCTGCGRADTSGLVDCFHGPNSR